MRLVLISAALTSLMGFAVTVPVLATAGDISSNGDAGAALRPLDQAVPTELAEIIVTAQKRSERLQDVPLSVSTVDPKELLSQNNLAGRDYLTQVPGVSLDEIGAGTDQITIRGIATGYGTNPLVGITIDDIPFGSSVYSSLGCCILPDLDPLVLDRIEVLRGPQGTLYGASAMGGLLKFVTSTPSATESGGRGELDGSTVSSGNQGYGVRAAYSTPIVTDALAMQVSVFDRQDPGYIRDLLQNRSDVNEDHVSGGRIAFLGKFDDFLTIKLAALYQQMRTAGSDMVDVNAATSPIYGPQEHERMPGTDGLDTHLQFYSLNLNADLGPISLVSLTGYQRLLFSNPTDGTLLFGALLPLFYPGANNVGINFADVIHTDRWTQEFRVASSGQQRLQYVAGVFYSSETNSLFQGLTPATYTTGDPLTQLPPLLNARIGQNYDQYAAFASLTLNLTDHFDLEGGGRYSHNKQTILQNQSGLLGGIPNQTVSDTENPSTYSAAARYRFDGDRMLYARIASGFRAGGPNFNYPPGHQSFQPDTTVNYEIGFKSEWLDRRVTLNPAVYYIDWSKIQVIQSTSSGLSYYTNGGKASSRGVELTLDVLPVRGLTIAGNLAYDDAKLDQNAPPNTFYGLDGDRLPFAAECTATVAADYNWRVSGSTSMFAGATAAYTGGRLIDFMPVASVPRLYLPAYTTVDFRLGADYDRLRASLFVKNVGNTRGYVGGIDFTEGVTNSPTGPFAAALIRPRTIGVSLSKDF